MLSASARFIGFFSIGDRAQPPMTPRKNHATTADGPAKEPHITHAMREYLQTAWRLGQRGIQLTVTSLADAQHVSPASATAMVKRLAGLRLMTHTHYGAIALTEEGARQALLGVRRHRLIECFLVRMLHYPIDQVHDESDRLEPVISDTFEEKIDAAMGFPPRCPHGDPIPDAKGIIRDPNMGYPLSEMKEGSRARVLRVPGSKPELLRYLVSLGIEPERPIELTLREPFGGPLHIKLGRKTVLLGPEAAQSVFVTQPVA